MSAPVAGSGAGSLFDPSLIGGGMALGKTAPITTTAAALTVSALHDGALVRVDATTANSVQTLPSAAATQVQNGPVQITIKKVDSSGHTVTIKANGSELIDGANTVVISAQWSAYTLICNGTGWDIIAKV